MNYGTDKLIATDFARQLERECTEHVSFIEALTESHEQLEAKLKAATAALEEAKKENERLTTELAKYSTMPKLLIEARDALPAISTVSARLHNVSLTLADRIESALEPWRIKE